MGYGSSYKGCRCLDPLNNKVFITWHVVFDEKIFLAKVKASLALPTPASPPSAPIFIPDDTLPHPLSIYYDISGTDPLPPSPNPSYNSTSFVLVLVEPSTSDGISLSSSVDPCDVFVPLASSTSPISVTFSSHSSFLTWHGHSIPY